MWWLKRKGRKITGVEVSIGSTGRDFDLTFNINV